MNSEEVRGPQAVATMFSDYFKDVGQSIVSAGIDLSSHRMHKHYFPPSEDTSLFLAPVSFAQFHKAMLINSLLNIMITHEMNVPNY